VVTVWRRRRVPEWPDWKGGVVMDVGGYDRWTGSLVRVSEAIGDLEVHDVIAAGGRFVAILNTIDWQHVDVHLASSTDGVAWIVHEVFDQDARWLTWTHQLATNGDDVYCLYPNPARESVLYRWSLDESSPELVHTFSDPELRPRKLAVRDDAIVAGFQRTSAPGVSDWRVGVVASDDGGATWTSPAWVPSDSLQSFELAIRPDGSWSVLAARRTYDAGSRYTPVLYSTADRGATWGTPDTLNCEGYLRGDEIDLALCPDGGLFAVWSEDARDWVGTRVAYRPGPGGATAPPASPLSVRPISNPAPFANGGRILAELASPSALECEVFTPAGRSLRRWRVPNTGGTTVYLYWDGRSGSGTRAHAGVYLWRVRAEGVGDDVARVVLY